MVTLIPKFVDRPFRGFHYCILNFILESKPWSEFKIFEKHSFIKGKGGVGIISDCLYPNPKCMLKKRKIWFSKRTQVGRQNWTLSEPGANNHDALCKYHESFYKQNILNSNVEFNPISCDFCTILLIVTYIFIYDVHFNWYKVRDQKTAPIRNKSGRLILHWNDVPTTTGQS